MKFAAIFVSLAAVASAATITETQLVSSSARGLFGQATAAVGNAANDIGSGAKSLGNAAVSGVEGVASRATNAVGNGASTIRSAASSSSHGGAAAPMQTLAAMNAIAGAGLLAALAL